MIGALADRTQHTLGPSSAPICCSCRCRSPWHRGADLFQPGDFGLGGKLVWAYGTYLLLMTVLHLRQSALQRACPVCCRAMRASAMRSTPRASSVPPLRAVPWSPHASPRLVSLARRLATPRLGWTLTMMVWGVAASLLFLVTFLTTTRARASRPRPGPPACARTWLTSRRNRPWLLLFFLSADHHGQHHAAHHERGLLLQIRGQAARTAGQLRAGLSAGRGGRHGPARRCSRDSSTSASC